MPTSKPRILILSRQHGGVGYYRQVIPARILERGGYPVTHFNGEVWWRALKPKERHPERYDWVQWLQQEHKGEFDLVWIDRPTEVDALAYFRGYIQESPDARLAIDFDDDFMNVPKGNPAYRDYQPGGIAYEASYLSLMAAEGVTLSTEPLERHVRDYCHHTTVLPNLIDPSDWVGFPVNPERHTDPHLRVLYSGAAGHYADLDEIREPMTSLITDPPVPFRLICYGSVPSWIRNLQLKHPARVVLLPWHHFEHYPESVAWGGFDLGIAPLAENTFNESKSDIRLQEHAIQDIPTVCSNVGPYADAPVDCFFKVANNESDWYYALRELLTDTHLRHTTAKRAKQWVMDAKTIESAPNLWYNWIEEIMQQPRLTTQELMQDVPANRLPGSDSQPA